MTFIKCLYSHFKRTVKCIFKNFLVWLDNLTIRFWGLAMIFCWWGPLSSALTVSIFFTVSFLNTDVLHVVLSEVACFFANVVETIYCEFSWFHSLWWIDLCFFFKVYFISSDMNGVSHIADREILWSKNPFKYLSLDRQKKYSWEEGLIRCMRKKYKFLNYHCFFITI